MSQFNYAKQLAAYNKINADNVDSDGKTIPFFSRNLNAYKANPAAHDSAMDACRETGKLRAKLFMNSVRDFSHKDHAKNFQTYDAKFGRDPKKVEQHFVDEEMEDNGISAVQYKDQSYEDRVLGGFKVGNNSDDENIVTNFRNLMQAKWTAIGGYKKGDNELIRDFFNTYPLSNASSMNPFCKKAVENPATGANAPGGGKKASY